MFDVNHGEFEELTITAETKQHYVVLTGTPRSVQANGSVFDTDMDANRRCGTIRRVEFNATFPAALLSSTA